MTTITSPTINPTPTPPVTPPTYEQKVANINSVKTTSAADKARAISYLTPDVKPNPPTVTNNTTTQTSTPNTPSTTNYGTPEQNKTISDATSKLNDYGTQLDDAYKTFKDTMAGYTNGSIPLTPGEQAQVNGLISQYQQLIEQQKLQNKGAEGTANIRGYQTGAAEYDPTFQAKTIGSIVTAGLQKVADLNTKMASSVAELTQKFKDNDMKAIKDAYDEYKSYQKEKTDALQKTIDSAQKEIDNYYNRTIKPIQDVALEAKKNGADEKTIAKIASSSNVTDAINNASIYLQSATGQLGDYIQYKKDMYQKGLVPEDYNSWKAKDDQQKINLKASEAYATAKATAKGKAAGTVPGTTVDENGNVITTGNLSALDIGRYNLAATRATKVFRESQAFKAAQNAGFYIAKIDAAKNNTGSIGDQEILDSISQFNTGGGRVTEAQVNLILKGKSLSDTVNSWSNKVKNGGILSDSQRKQALEIAKATADNFLKNYEDKYKPLAENLTKQGIPKEFWGVPTPEALKGEVTQDAKTQVDNYVASHTDMADTIAGMYEVPVSPGEDRDQSILDYINLITNPKQPKQ